MCVCTCSYPIVHQYGERGSTVSVLQPLAVDGPGESPQLRLALVLLPQASADRCTCCTFMCVQAFVVLLPVTSISSYVSDRIVCICWSR